MTCFTGEPNSRVLKNMWIQTYLQISTVRESIFSGSQSCLEDAIFRWACNLIKMCSQSCLWVPLCGDCLLAWFMGQSWLWVSCLWACHVCGQFSACRSCLWVTWLWVSLVCGQHSLWVSLGCGGSLVCGPVLAVGLSSVGRSCLWPVLCGPFLPVGYLSVG